VSPGYQLIVGQKVKVKVTGSQSAKHISVEGDRVAGVSLYFIECPPSSFIGFQFFMSYFCKIIFLNVAWVNC